MVSEVNSTFMAINLRNLFVVGSNYQLRHCSSWYITQQPERVVRYAASFAKHGLLLLWSPYVIGQTIIFLPCDFYLSSFFFSFFSSPNLSGRRLDVYHTFTHGVALVRI